MSVDDVLMGLEENDEVTESYVLFCEIKTYLDVGHSFYQPRIRIKIYKSNVIHNSPYHFDVSHHVHTPEQASPYYPSRISFETEREAINQAISSTTSFIKVALRAGHEPSKEWLVANEDF